MVSKVQTFEEWMDKTLWGECFVGRDRANMRAVWQAAHENAARVCDDMHDPYDGPVVTAKWCASAIREAAK